MRLAIHYRQAVVLNNLGVSLLEKRQFSLAMGIIRSALSEMKMLVSPSDGPDQNDANTTAEKIKRANQVLIGLDQTSQIDQPSSMALDVGGFHLPAVLNLVMDAGCFSSTLSPIRIELNDFETLHDRDTDLDSAIMLYNLGLAHRAVAIRERDFKQEQRIHQGALRLFRMAFTLVSNTELPSSRSFEEEQAMIRNRVHASAIFLYFQVRTLIDLQLQTEAEEGLRHLSILGSELADVMDMGFAFQTGTPSAAAA